MALTIKVSIIAKHQITFLLEMEQLSWSNPKKIIKKLFRWKELSFLPRYVLRQKTLYSVDPTQFIYLKRNSTNEF